MASKVLRWSGRILVAVLAGLLIAAAAVYFLSQRALGDMGEKRSLKLAAPTPAQLADAPRMLRVLGCAGCHGPALRGKPFKLPAKIASIYATNLTRLAARVDDATLDRAIRGGVGHDGRALLIMPSPGYQALTDQETAALIAAIRAISVGGAEDQPRAFGPLGRLGLALGSFKAAPRGIVEQTARALPAASPANAAGRHLVAIACADCHGSDLQGKRITPEVSSVDLAIVGAYDLAQFRTLLRTGVPPSGRELPLMSGVARSNYSRMTEAEVAAVHAYLTEVAARRP